MMALLFPDGALARPQPQGHFLLSSGCRHRTPQAQGLESQQFIFDTFASQEVQGQSADHFRSWKEPSSQLADHLLSASSPGLSAERT